MMSKAATQLLIFFILLNPQLWANQSETDELRVEDSDWSYLTGGFREKHHFSVLVGSGLMKWGFENVGPADRQGARLHSSTVRYHYYLPFYRKFGYFLGTSVGYALVDFEHPELGRLDMVRFPGVSGGLTLELTRYLRANALLEYQLERWHGLRADLGEPIHVSATSFASRYFLEYFFALKWALMAEFEDRRSFYTGAKDSKGLATSAIVSYHEQSFGLGLNYHFL
jgi:hypothetical protein